MLGLRFFACDRCQTVHAVPERPPCCSRCEDESLIEITRTLRADTYFATTIEHGS